MVLAAPRPRFESDRRTGGNPHRLDASFYSRYEWCLNPLLTLRDQLSRLGEELAYASQLAGGWQRDECVINVYLLVCGIACTVDDYLGPRAWDLTFIAERFPGLRSVVPIVRQLLSLPPALRQRIGDHPVRRWRARWARCVDMACEMLVEAATRDEDHWSELRSTCETLRWATLPRRLLQRRLRIPEGLDRKSTRLNSSHLVISYAVFCLKKKKKKRITK